MGARPGRQRGLPANRARRQIPECADAGRRQHRQCTLSRTDRSAKRGADTRTVSPVEPLRKRRRPDRAALDAFDPTRLLCRARRGEDGRHTYKQRAVCVWLPIHITRPSERRNRPIAYLNAAKLTGFLDMNGIRIGSDLFMRSEMPKKGEILRADFADIDLTNARVGQVDLSGAKVSGLLNLDGIMVGRHVHLEAASDNAIKSEFSQIILDASRIGGSLVLMDATVSGELKCRLMDVSQIVI